MSFNTTLHIAPVGRREQVSRSGFVYDSPKARVYKKNVKLLLSAKTPPKALGPIKVVVRFYLPKPKKPKYNLPAVRPDLDNYLKAFLDACTGILYEDDSQIIDLHGLKLYSETPSVYVSVEAV